MEGKRGGGGVEQRASDKRETKAEWEGNERRRGEWMDGRTDRETERGWKDGKTEGGRCIVGSSRVTSGRAVAVPGSCGVCRNGGCVVAHPCAPFCVPIQPNSSPHLRLSLPSPPPLSPSFIVPYRHIDSFSNSISLNGIKTILLRVRELAAGRGS